MSNNKTLPFRVQPLWNTTAGWAADTTTIPVLGEDVAEQTISGNVLKKAGDGIHNFAGLPYLGSGTFGDYLGEATTATVPPSLASNAYYFTVETGTFTHLSGITVPSTSVFAVLSYYLDTTTWSYLVVLDSSMFPGGGSSVHLIVESGTNFITGGSGNPNNTYTAPYLVDIVNIICYNNQTYINGIDFSQNLGAGSITWINGASFVDGRSFGTLN